jgi:hypothetical protein
MILETKNLKPYTKLFASTKIAGNAYYDHVFLDFRKRTLSFFTDTTSVRLSLFVRDQQEETFLYVDGMKFFQLVANFDQLEIKDNKFYGNKNKFSLPTLDEDLSFSLEEDYSGEIFSLTFTKSFLSDFLMFKEFLEKDPTAYQALFFQSSASMVISPTRFMLSTTELDPAISFSIPTSVVKAIDLLPIQENEVLEFRMKSSSNGGKIVEFNYNDLFYRFASSSDIELPVDPFDEDFTSSFMHKEFFELNASEAYDTLKFISDFLKQEANHSRLDFLEDSIKITATYDSEIEYILPVIQYSDLNFFIDQNFWIVLNSLLSAINIFVRKKVDTLSIHYSVDGPAIMIEDAKKESDFFIVQTLVQDPSL